MSNRAFYLKALQVRREEQFVLPSDEFANAILKHFKMSKDDFEQAFHQVAGAFAKLWSFKSNPNLSYDFKAGRVFHEGMSYRVLAEMADSKSGAFIYEISGWISTPELNAILESAKKQTGKLVPHKDLFGLIVGGVLKGKDLISACLSSTAVNKQCEANDQQLFKHRLEEEFDIDFDDETYDYPDARSLYIQMHTLYARRYEEEFSTLIIPYVGDRQSHKMYGDVDGAETILVPQSGDQIGADWEPTREVLRHQSLQRTRERGVGHCAVCLHRRVVSG